MKLLLIEDDQMLASGLCKALEREGFVVESAQNGLDGLKYVESFEPQILVLDLGLPDIDGTQVLRKLRLNHASLPVLVLTARHSTQDKVAALDLGADDYLQKPFDMPELLARIRVLARRLGTSTTNVIANGNVLMDVAAHSVQVDEKKIDLTRREFHVLKALMENTGRVQTKDMIETNMYGWGEPIGSNTIEVHISNLRKKLPNQFIKTIRGLGYIIQNPSKTSKKE